MKTEGMKMNDANYKCRRKRNLALSLAFCLLVSTLSACGANEISAIAMRLQRMVGTVHLFDDKGKEKSLQEQMRLLDGDKINTDAESLVMVSLDETKLVTMEENASADIMGSGKKLVFKINEGNVFINVTEKLAEGESFDVQTSNMICGIRGTSLGTGTDAEGHEYVYATDGSFIATATDEKGNTTTAEAAPGTMLTLYKGAEADNGKISFAKRTMTVEDLPAIALDAITKSKALKNRIVAATGFDEKKIEVLAKLSSKPATTMYGQAADDFKKEGVDDSMPLMGEQAREMTASAQAARDMSNGNFDVEMAVVTGCRGVLDAGTSSGYSGASLSGLMNSARNSFKKVVDKAATDGLEGDALTEKVNKATEELQKTAEEAVKENKTEEEIEKALDEKAEELAEEIVPDEKQEPTDEAGKTEGTGTGDATASEQPAEGTGNTGTGDTQEGGNTGNAAGTGDSEGPDASNPPSGNPPGEGTSSAGSEAGSSVSNRFTDSQIEALRSIFDAEYYASLYPDVVAEYGNDPDALFKHFLEHGINEGRNVNPDFNVSAYKSAYGDLAEAYGDNIADYYLHYAQVGQIENRSITTIEEANEAGITVKDAVTGETISTPEAPPSDPGPSSDNGSGDSGSGSGGGGGYYSGGSASGNNSGSASGNNSGGSGSGGGKLDSGYTISTKALGGNGTIELNSNNQNGKYASGAHASVILKPNSGYTVTLYNVSVKKSSGSAVDFTVSRYGNSDQFIVEFIMPDSNVEVQATFTPNSNQYTISFNHNERGEISMASQTADTITLKFAPRSVGYTVDRDSIRFLDDNENDLDVEILEQLSIDDAGVGTLKISRPNANVTVDANFIGVTTRYSIIPNLDTGASVVISGGEVSEDNANIRLAYEGQKITITPSNSAPNTAVGEVLYTTGGANSYSQSAIKEGTGAYFYMPAGDVSLSIGSNRPKASTIELTGNDDRNYNNGDTITISVSDDPLILSLKPLDADGNVIEVCYTDWTIENTDIAELQADDSSMRFKVKPKSAGTTVLTVTADDVSVTLTVKVTEATEWTIPVEDGQSNGYADISLPSGGSFRVSVANASGVFYEYNTVIRYREVGDDHEPCYDVELNVGGVGLAENALILVNGGDSRSVFTKNSSAQTVRILRANVSPGTEIEISANIIGDFVFDRSDGSCLFNMDTSGAADKSVRLTIANDDVISQYKVGCSNGRFVFSPVDDGGYSSRVVQIKDYEGEELITSFTPVTSFSPSAEDFATLLQQSYNDFYLATTE